MDYTQAEVVKLLIKNDPIVVCDGSSISPFFEKHFLSWLKFQGIPASIEDKLYEREDFDLSSYKTIAFNTQGDEKLKEPFEKIIKSFSKENLKVVIIGNEKSYFKVKDLAEKLGIILIGFDYYVPMIMHNKMRDAISGLGIKVNLSEVWEVDDLPGLFYDPKQKFC